MSMLRTLFAGLGSVKLTVVLLLLLALLTYLGTLSQIQNGLFQSQRMYFESWLVLHPVRDLRLPLPGGHAVMVLLFVNLLIGGFVRMRRTWRIAGVYVTHFGIALLLLAGFVKLEFSDDGYLAVWEGDQANFFESHYHWELAVARAADGSREFVIDEDVLRGAHGARLALQHQDLPFDLVVDAYAPNVTTRQDDGDLRDTDVVEGTSLLALPLSVEREHDLPGGYLTLRPRTEPEQRLVILGSEMLRPRPRVVTVGGEQWTVELRKKRYPLPFTIRVDDFRKEVHPGTTMARSFESDVTQRVGRDERRVKIEMNQPLRDEGFILFQSNWGPQGPGNHTRFWSLFSVVRNPSDQWPLIACIVIALGLSIHFILVLWRYVAREARSA